MRTFLTLAALLLCTLALHGQDAATISNLVPPQVARYQIVAASSAGGVKVFKIDSVTGQVWQIAKQISATGTGQMVEVEGWVLVPTMAEAQANVRAVYSNDDPKLRSALEAARK